MLIIYLMLDIFSMELLRRFSPELSEDAASKDDHLVVVVVRGG